MIELDKALLLAVKGASTKYKIHLEERKKERVLSDVEKQKLVLANDLSTIKEQCDAIKFT